MWRRSRTWKYSSTVQIPQNCTHCKCSTPVNVLSYIPFLSASKVYVQVNYTFSHMNLWSSANKIHYFKDVLLDYVVITLLSNIQSLQRHPVRLYWTTIWQTAEWVKEVISSDTVAVVLSDLTYLKSFKAIQDERSVFQPKETKRERNRERISVFSQVNFLFHSKATLTSLESRLLRFRPR